MSTTDNTFAGMLEAIEGVAVASQLMHAADSSDNVTFRQNGDELTAIAPEGMAWQNGEHGLTVNVRDAAAVAEALQVLEAGTVECREAEGCDVCDYGATESEDTFAVWVSTFGLYSNGYLIGYWCPAAEAPVTEAEFVEGLAARGQKLPANVAALVGGELNCFDTEYSPVRGEMHPAEARAIAEAMAVIEADDMEAFRAVARDQHAATAADIERIAGEFEDTFAGYWDNAEAYAEDFLDSCGMLTELPEWARGYFDMAAYARDLELGGDISHLTTSGGIGFIVRNY